MTIRQTFSLLALAACAACGGSQAPEDPAAAADDDASAAARALEQLSGAYDELASVLDRDPGEAVDWAQGDLENLGDWEYRIVEFARGDTAVLESELNALGDERWEVFWMEATASGIRVYLKRSSISYLSRLPLAALVRLFGGGGQ